MKFNVTINQPHYRDETLLLGIFENAPSLSGAAARFDALTNGLISSLVRNGEFSAKLNQTLPLIPVPQEIACRVLLVGLGKEQEFSLHRLRSACATGARSVRDHAGRRIALPCDFTVHPACPLPNRIRAYVEGVQLGLYRFQQFKTKNKVSSPNDPDQCTIYLSDAHLHRQIRDEVKKASTIADAVCLARDLVNLPSNVATPSFLAAQARSLAKTSGIRCKVLDAKNAQQLGMHAFLSVARGSDEPPQFIVLEYRPRTKKHLKPVVLIGKAVTFDSGGISLKPAKDMDEMKNDMAGGAAVFAVIQACAHLALPIPVVGFIPAAENLPSGHALKPGDIITTMSGTTVEIITTDAEGRLLLADALTYAQRYKPAAIIDIATLTGACVIALGNEAAGLMGTDDRLLRMIMSAADATGERVWELPLWAEYDELLKSDVADIKNAGGRPAGAITAGCFLKHFAGATAWAHLDIAGTAWTKKSLPLAPKGATGAGVRLLISVLERWNQCDS